jgi:hypothetical protein
MGETQSDAQFEGFLATVKEADLSPYERDLYRHYRFEALKAS